MLRTILLLIICFLCISLHSQTDQKSLRDIETVLFYYLEGGSKGDSILLSKAFLPDGQMRYLDNDRVANFSLEKFVASTRNGEVEENAKGRIESIQVSGNAALAKITIEFPFVFFHDIMGLLKTKDGWKIVSKICYSQPRKK